MDLWNAIGTWNPQLLRELKHRLKGHYLWLALGVSLFAQMAILLFFSGQLPDSLELKPDQSGMVWHYYCTGQTQEEYGYSFPCLRDNFGQIVIDFPRWWQDIYMALTRIVPVLPLVGGVYLLIADLAKEKQRGTLDFLRISPQTSQKILLGKLIGIPILLYGLMLTMLPLHLYAALQAQLPILHPLFVYIGLLATWGILASLGMVYGLTKGAQAWLGAGLTFPLSILVGSWLTWDYQYEWRDPSVVYWFDLPITSTSLMGLGVIVAQAGVAIYWIWQILSRRFYSPSLTVISKPQSYGMMACCQLGLLGYSWSRLLGIPAYERYQVQNILGFYTFFNLLLSLLLIAAVSPGRQALLDWARYRQRVGSWSRIGQDLLWSEKSPAYLAVAINLLIASGIWLPCILLTSDPDIRFWGVAGLALNSSLILIYGLLVQWILLQQLQHAWLGAGAAVAAALTLPPLLLWLWLGSTPEPMAWVLLLIYGASAGLAHSEPVGWITILGVMLGQMGLVLVLLAGLNRSLRQAGASESQLWLAQAR
ncbi:MAG: hypothetical protein NW237_05560 [Cyanobacteriota bacterium]|nr:hypothetical protein [Cyanobacteriota bacterium]